MTKIHMKITNACQNHIQINSMSSIDFSIKSNLKERERKIKHIYKMMKSIRNMIKCLWI